MGKRRNRADRCALCRLHVGLCICASLPRIDTRTRVVLVLHRTEDRRSTNTGRIAASCLRRSQIVVRGDVDAPVDDLGLDHAGTEPLLLYPHDDAAVLERRPEGAPPVTLVVPDGNWRQAGKVRARVRGLASLRAVRLPEGPPSRYRLRRWSHAHGLSTLEAIARAIDVLEGGVARAELERVLDALVERTLWVKGALRDDEVQGGLPEGAMRHAPSAVAPPIRRP
ncbi:MAG: tRNA-uridine aminocarboxypropyltransferase [Polyangiaceae bacterium]